MKNPPAIAIDSPVMYEESSEHKNAAAPAISSGCPIRLNGVTDLIASSAPSASVIAELNLVLMTPGQIQLTRMFDDANSTASTLVNPKSAVLEIEYAPIP